MYLPIIPPIKIATFTSWVALAMAKVKSFRYILPLHSKAFLIPKHFFFIWAPLLHHMEINPEDNKGLSILCCPSIFPLGIQLIHYPDI